MDIRKLQRAIVDGLEDVKAHHIVVFNTEHLSPLFERVIIASGTSNRQTKALAASVRDAVKAGGMPVLSVEGEDNGEWIIVDCGAAVAHIMQPAIRDYYRLEELWGEKPVKMKIGSGAGAMRQPRVSDQPVVRRQKSRDASSKTGAKQPVPRPKPVKRSAPRKGAAKKTRASKTPSRKTAYR